MNRIAIAPFEDENIESLKEQFDIILYWEEYSISWFLSVNKLGFKLIDASSKILWESNLSDKLYVRYPQNSNPKVQESMCLIQGLGYLKNTHLSDPSKIPQSKASQLIDLGMEHPLSVISNRVDFLLKENKKYIAKSLSYTRSQTFKIDSDDIRETKLPLPTLFQEYVEGKEYKIHIRKFSRKHFSFALEIDKKSIDYRNDLEGTQFKLSTTPICSEEFLEKQSTRYGANLYDMDFIVSDEGRIVFLEWNSSPAFGYLESQISQNRLYSSLLLADEKILLISKHDDRCHLRLAQNANENNLKHFALELLDVEWTPIVVNRELFLKMGRKCYYSSALYLRSTGSEDKKTSNQIRDLSFLIENCDQAILGHAASQYLNGSKLQQSVWTKRKLASDIIKFPKSVIIKTDLLTSMKNLFTSKYIVKSLSSTRSIVVDGDEFKDWNNECIGFLPTLFQEKIEGVDYRIHVTPKSEFAIKIDNKSSTDYRYAKERSFVQVKLDAQLINDLHSIRSSEANLLIGVDLMKKDELFYYLESNPGPAWAWFYKQDDKILDQAIIKELNSYA